MPLSAAELTALKTDVQAVVDGVNALVADPVPHPLQVELDAANARIATLTTERDTANASVVAMQAKIDAAKAKLVESAAADVAEDAGRQGAIDALA